MKAVAWLVLAVALVIGLMTIQGAVVLWALQALGFVSDWSWKMAMAVGLLIAAVGGMVRTTVKMER